MATVVIKGITVDTASLAPTEAPKKENGQDNVSKGFIVPSTHPQFQELWAHVAQSHYAVGYGTELFAGDGTVIGSIQGAKYSKNGELVPVFTNFQVLAQPNAQGGVIIYPEPVKYRLANEVRSTGLASEIACQALIEARKEDKAFIVAVTDASAASARSLGLSPEEMEKIREKAKAKAKAEMG